MTTQFKNLQDTSPLPIMATWSWSTQTVRFFFLSSLKISNHPFCEFLVEFLFHFKVIGFNADTFALYMCTECGMYSKKGSGSKLNTEALEIFWDMITIFSVCLHLHADSVPVLWKLRSTLGRNCCLWYSKRGNITDRSFNLPDDLLSNQGERKLAKAFTR